jgi:glycosyl transferase family (putative galactosyltransferase)
MDWDKAKILDDPRVHAALNRSTTLARQHKPFIAFLLFASFVLFCMHLPWSQAGQQYPSGSPYRAIPNVIPEKDPIFNQTVSQHNGSLEIIPEVSAGKKARWAKVAVASGFEDIVYERALETHIGHAEKHGYPMYVGRENAADGMFNKIAFILNIVLQELYKPAEERVEWLFYFDADTIIMNKEIPLEIFEPPSDYDHINYIAARDWNGLNAGVLILRICPWTVTLLSRTMTYKHYHPDEAYVFEEQTILARLTENDKEFHKEAIYMPRPWFNAYFYGMHEVKPGMLLSHFAHPDFKWHMYEWLKVAYEEDGSDNPIYQKQLKDTEYPDEIKRFWNIKRRADRVIKGFERNVNRGADPIQFGLQHEETKALAEDFRTKFDDLKYNSFFGTDNPEDLERKIIAAEDVSNYLLLYLIKILY